MAALVLLNGVVSRRPEQRTAANGNKFVSTSVRVSQGAQTQWYRVSAFSDSAQQELLRLGEGDGVSVQGPLRIENFEQHGIPKIGLAVTADSVLALRPGRKETAPKAPPPPDTRTREQRVRGFADPDLNDDVPF